MESGDEAPRRVGDGVGEEWVAPNPSYVSAGMRRDPDIFLDGYTRRAKPRDSLNSLGLIHPREAFGLLSL